MRSPYVAERQSLRSMQPKSLKTEDPVKLIDQLQSYIIRLQNAARDVPRRRAPKGFYEKLSFDFQQSRDLPPAIRAVVEDNRMLKSFVKEWKARCLLAENKAQKERLRSEQFRQELESFRKNFTKEDLEAIEKHKELEKAVDELSSSVKMKEAAIAVLQKKQQVDARLHQAALTDEAKKRDALSGQIERMEEEFKTLKTQRRAEVLEVKRLVGKHESYRRKAAEWKRQLEDSLQREKLYEVAAAQLERWKDRSFLDQGVATEPYSENVFVMLCLIQEEITKDSLEASEELNLNSGR